MMCGKGSSMLASCRGYYHPGSSLLGFLFSLVLTFTLPCCSCLVAQLCQTLPDPTDYSTPAFPVLHHLLEPAQTHVH